MGKLTAAITQMASENDWTKNSDKAERLVREAAAKGAKLILLQELFDGDYFCIEQHAKFLRQAEELDRHPTVKRFAALAKELGVVLPGNMMNITLFSQIDLNRSSGKLMLPSAGSATKTRPSWYFLTTTKCLKPP